jgi:hypothetical protein
MLRYKIGDSDLPGARSNHALQNVGLGIEMSTRDDHLCEPSLTENLTFLKQALLPS